MTAKTAKPTEVAIGPDGETVVVHQGDRSEPIVMEPVTGDRRAPARVSDMIESGFDEFYPDAQKVTIDAVMGMGDVLILDVIIVENFETEFGSHPLAIIAVSPDIDSNQVYTFPSSGQVIVDKLRQLKTRHLLPLVGAFSKTKRYYDVK